MKVFKRFFELYIFANIHVAIATWALVKISLYQFHIIDDYSPLFVFFSTILSYNFIRLYRFKSIDSWFSHWLKNNQKILIIISSISLLGILFTVIHISFNALLLLIPFSFFTLFYSLPLFKQPLRTVPLLKIILIAISWAGITVLFPLINAGISVLNWAVLGVFIQRFLFVFAITIPFDIRDITYDNKSLKTMPQLFGIAKSKYIGFLMILGFLYINNTYLNITNIIITSISFLGLVFARKNQNKYYAAFWIESIPIIWYILILNQAFFT